MKKLIALISLILAISCLFAACSSDGNTDDIIDYATGDEQNNNQTDAPITDAPVIDEPTTQPVLLETECLTECCPHAWVDASCTAPKTCSLCNETEGYPVHTLGADGKCTKCGAFSVPMTDEEKEAAMAVKTMEYSINEYSDEVRLYVYFVSEYGYSKYAPAYVEVKILGEDGSTVLYSDTLLKKSSDSYVSIDYDNVIPLKSSKGTLCFKVYNDYFSFDEVSLSLEKLPWTVDIELPKLPAVVWTYEWASYIITNLTYKVSDDDVTFYFTAEKLYDEEGNNYSRNCTIGWKLYDSEGYVIEDGTFYGNALKVGEKFKDEDEKVYGVIEQGKTYRFEVLSVG